MRVALIAPVNFNQWLSLTVGLQRGFQMLGHEARVFPLATPYFPTIEIESFAAYAPSLVLFFHFARPAGHRSCVLTDELVRVAPEGTRFALLAFDNPYDLQSCADLVARSPFISHVFTPEPGTLPIYEARGIRASVLRAWADPILFAPTPPVGESAEKEIDVLWVGDLRNERGHWIQSFREACARHRLSLFEVTMRRPLWGRDLARVIRRSRLGIEAKRVDLSTQSCGVRYTWTSPRSYMFAACGTPWVCVGEWGEMDRDFPAHGEIGHVAQVPHDALADVVRAMVSDRLAASFEGTVRQIQNRRMHSPEHRASEILSVLFSEKAFP